jgi:phosphatidate cytidylyltransferase
MNAPIHQMRDTGPMRDTDMPSPSSAGRPGLSDLRTRVVSAAVLAPPVLVAVWLGGWAFGLLLMVAGAIGADEWMNIVTSGRPKVARRVASGVVVAVVLATAMGGPVMALVVAVAGAGFVAALVPPALRRVAAAGIVYVAFGVVALDWLRGIPDGGLGLFFYGMLVVWATDIGAFAAGRTIGGPKLAPRISPKKTWAGLFGGMAAAALVGWAVAESGGAARPVVAGCLGLVLAVCAQAGDLFESAVKRRFGVKDSGHLIPGHGGMLDRIDGLLVAAPVLALFQAALGGELAWW